MTSASSSSFRADTLENARHFVLEDVSWDFYEHLLREIGNRATRVTFANGRLELLSPFLEHERSRKFIGRMVDMLAFDLDKPIRSYGSTTFRRKDLSVGLEPDESYYFENEAKMRGRKRLDMAKDPPPELVIEIALIERYVRRLPIFAALGVPEIWQWNGRKLQCLHLIEREYRARKHSLAFPCLQPAQLTRFVQQLWERDENSILHEFLAWAREQSAAI